MKTKLIAATLLGLLGLFNSPVTAHAAAIPRDQIGAVAGEQYSGDSMAVSSRSDGATPRCVEGAKAEAMAGGARPVPAGGRPQSSHRLAVALDDAGGEYLELWFCCDIAFVIVVAAAAFAPINWAPFKAQRRLPPSPRKGHQPDEITQELPIPLLRLPAAGRQRLMPDGFDLRPSQKLSPRGHILAAFPRATASRFNF